MIRIRIKPLNLLVSKRYISEIKMDKNVRIESDTMGEVVVPSEAYYGAQTQRSIENFPIGIGKYTWDRSIIKAMGVLKKCAALANRDLKQITPEIALLIIKAADEVIEGKHDKQFPLVVFQTGSGTQVYKLH